MVSSVCHAEKDGSRSYPHSCTKSQVCSRIRHCIYLARLHGYLCGFYSQNSEGDEIKLLNSISGSMNPPDRFVVRSHLKDHPSNHPQIYPSSFCHFVWTIRLSCYVRFYFGVGPVVSTSSYRKSKWNALRSSGFFSKI
jgi:hypothetical protein